MFKIYRLTVWIDLCQEKVANNFEVDKHNLVVMSLISN